MYYITFFAIFQKFEDTIPYLKHFSDNYKYVNMEPMNLMKNENRKSTVIT